MNSLHWLLAINSEGFPWNHTSGFGNSRVNQFTLLYCIVNKMKSNVHVWNYIYKVGTIYQSHPVYTWGHLKLYGNVFCGTSQFISDFNSSECNHTVTWCVIVLQCFSSIHQFLRWLKQWKNMLLWNSVFAHKNVDRNNSHVSNSLQGLCQGKFMSGFHALGMVSCCLKTNLIEGDYWPPKQI